MTQSSRHGLVGSASDHGGSLSSSSSLHGSNIVALLSCLPPFATHLTAALDMLPPLILLPRKAPTLVRTWICSSVSCFLVSLWNTLVIKSDVCHGGYNPDKTLVSRFEPKYARSPWFSLSQSAGGEFQSLTSTTQHWYWQSRSKPRAMGWRMEVG
jgi:hypothetical protein